MKNRTPACACPPASPFRWAESYTPGSSFAISLQRNAASSKASSDLVQSSRVASITISPRMDADRSKKLRLTAI